MTDWWQEPYRGGPMVPVAGFPRELHVGDKDGPDVIGYKRTVWRAGRWQGPASRFDDSFSQGFSTGAGPNVVDTGIAGVQRQQNLPDTGVVDEKTFNTLRSLRVARKRRYCFRSRPVRAQAGRYVRAAICCPGFHLGTTPCAHLAAAATIRCRASRCSAALMAPICSCVFGAP